MKKIHSLAGSAGGYTWVGALQLEPRRTQHNQSPPRQTIRDGHAVRVSLQPEALSIVTRAWTNGKVTEDMGVGGEVLGEVCPFDRGDDRKTAK